MKWSRLALATLAFLLASALYAVGYFAAIERRSISFYHLGYEEISYFQAARIGGAAMEWVYYPVIQIDYLMRPDHWEPVERELPPGTEFR